MKSVIFISLLGVMLAGCNTMEGFGEDLQAAGSNLEHSAEKHNPRNSDRTPHPGSENNSNRDYDDRTYNSVPVDNTY